MFEVENLRSGYGEIGVLKELSFAVQDEIFAVLGSNGAGKTTLLKALARLLPVQSGRLKLDGRM
jgi:branched-chain amino acid transport system ATP-binding protein